MAKTETFKMRLSLEEKEAYQEAARLAGISVAAWMTERLRRSSRMELTEAGKKVPFDRKPKQ
jgi:predicted HicB family RNase H-like nuclease